LIASKKFFETTTFFFSLWSVLKLHHTPLMHDSRTSFIIFYSISTAQENKPESEQSIPARVSQCDWKELSDDKMEAPTQTENMRSGGATTLTYTSARRMQHNDRIQHKQEVIEQNERK
jgi:hypothetical protein